MAMEKWNRKQRVRLAKRVRAYEEAMASKSITDKVQRSLRRPGSQKKS